MLQDYYIPKSIADTLALLKDNNRRQDHRRGTDLVLDHQAKKITADAFIDISNIDELKKIEISRWLHFDWRCSNTQPGCQIPVDSRACHCFEARLPELLVHCR